MSKVTVVGAGNVGATCANVLAFNEVADEVVMLDVKEGVSEGKAMDMMQTAQLLVPTFLLTAWHVSATATSVSCSSSTNCCPSLQPWKM